MVISRWDYVTKSSLATLHHLLLELTGPFGYSRVIDESSEITVSSGTREAGAEAVGGRIFAHTCVFAGW